jgi:hypothetical protein
MSDYSKETIKMSFLTMLDGIENSTTNEELNVHNKVLDELCCQIQEKINGDYTVMREKKLLAELKKKYEGDLSLLNNHQQSDPTKKESP